MFNLIFYPMKQFTRFFSVVLVLVFATGIAFSQNHMRWQTKAQVLGLKQGKVKHYQPRQTMNVLSTPLLTEGFDQEGVFPPTDWSVTVTNANNTWMQGNPEGHDFNQIDPNSLYSALCPWVAEDQDEWLITPVIDAAGETPVTLDWYAGVSGPWLTAATLKCLISTDNGTTWTELWNAADEIDPGADWAWNEVSIDLSAYASTPFQIAWQYVGNDGDLAGVDGVSVTSGYEYLFQDDFESYNVGDYLALNSDTWTTWSNAPGTSEDAFVVDEQSSSPTKSVEVEGSTDLILPMGNKTSGRYQINMKYYVVSGMGAYFNIQHFEQPGIEWAYEVYFGATGDGYMNAAGNQSAFFTYNHDEWLNLKSVIDLDLDSAWFYLNDQLVYTWQFSLQADGTPGTKQLGGMDVFAGAPQGETPHYYMDDVEYIVLDPGITNPIINVDNSAISATLEEGETTTATFSMGNDGQEDLNYQIVVTYPQSTKAFNHEPAGIHASKETLKNIQKAPAIQKPAANPSNRDAVLHYDGDPFTAIGTSVDYEWRVAAKFPSEMVQPYIGMEISSVDIFTNDPGNAFKLQIYGMGSYNTPGPGTLLVEQDFTATPGDWTTVVLDNPVYVDGQDLWVGYWVSAPGGTFVPGCDDGTNYNTDADWMSAGPGWGHLGDNPDLMYNWNIRANLTGDPIVQWLSTDPTEGTLQQDEYIDVTVTMDATNLTSAIYTGKLNIRNNDPDNELVTITVMINVTVGVNEHGEKEYVVMYPNPANDYLNIGSNGEIHQITIANSIGQIVFDETMNTEKRIVNISDFTKGVYFVTVKTNHGLTTQKIVVK